MRDRFAVSFYGRSGNPSLRLQHSIGSVGLQRADIIRPYGLVFCTGCVGEAISFPLCQRDGKPALPCPRSAAAGIRTQSPPAVSDMAKRQRDGKPVPYADCEMVVGMQRAWRLSEIHTKQTASFRMPFNYHYSTEM